MSVPPQAVDVSLDLRAVASTLAAINQSAIPVLDEGGAFVGILASRDLMDALASGEDSGIRSLMRTGAPVPLDHPIGEAIQALDHGADAVAVADSDGKLVGWVRHRDVLAALS